MRLLLISCLLFWMPVLVGGCTGLEPDPGLGADRDIDDTVDDADGDNDSEPDGEKVDGDRDEADHRPSDGDVDKMEVEDHEAERQDMENREEIAGEDDPEFSCQYGFCCPDGAPAHEGEVCIDDGDPCTRDICREGSCDHFAIENDCGDLLCGPSPSNCYTCGGCGEDDYCRAGACFDSTQMMDSFLSTCLLEDTVICDRDSLHGFLREGWVGDWWWNFSVAARLALADRIVRDHMFSFITWWREGLPDCGGGTEDWQLAICGENAVMRYLRFGKGERFSDKVSHCYWRDETGSQEHCLWEESFNLPVIMVLGNVPELDGGHVMTAIQILPDIRNFYSWFFFQFDESGISPGSEQMPCGVEGYPVRLYLEKLIDLDCRSFTGERFIGWSIDTDCKLTQIPY